MTWQSGFFVEITYIYCTKNPFVLHKGHKELKHLVERATSHQQSLDNGWVHCAGR